MSTTIREIDGALREIAACSVPERLADETWQWIQESEPSPKARLEREIRLSQRQARRTAAKRKRAHRREFMAEFLVAVAVLAAAVGMIWVLAAAWAG